MENQKDIQGLLQDTFRDHEATPPRDIWAAIEADIRPQSKRKIVWWPYMAVAASALILLGLWTLLAPAPQIDPGFAQEQRPQPSLEQLSTVPESSPEQELATIEADTSRETPVERQPLYQTVAQDNRPKPQPQPQPEQNEEALDKDEPEVPASTQGFAVINPMSPIEPQLNVPNLPIKPESATATKPVRSTAAVDKPKLQEVKDNKLNINDFSLENVVAFASSELSKLSGSPLEYQHQRGEDAERKVYELQLGEFKITRTSFRKTINQ